MTNEEFAKWHEADKKKRRKQTNKIILIVIASFIGIILLGAIVGENSTTDNTVVASTGKPDVDLIKIGDVLETDYFDVTVHEIEVAYSVKTGNQFADLGPEAGNAYLLLKVTFKNTDTESRMIDEGALVIDYNGKEYEFDKSEIIMLEGWGILLDQINPLTSKSTILVYKIPAEISGPAYYQPGRNSDDKRIYLGNINFKSGG